jgi:osmoprotectant transport system permease protein
LIRYLAFLAAFFVASSALAKAPVRIGSKRFTESYILAELAVVLARQGGDAEVTHQQGLGGTALVYRALEEGSIDVYPEYTGTIVEAILHEKGRMELPAIRKALAEHGIGVTESLGFEDKYALAVRAEFAKKQGLVNLEDLSRVPSAKVGLSPEFLGRSDGWPGLVTAYQLAPQHVDGIDHGLAYEAISKGAIDVMDVYTTDANIVRYELQLLNDTRHFFPSYEAVFLYRLDLPARAPKAFAQLVRAVGAIDGAAMTQMNAEAELKSRTFDSIARDFAASKLGVAEARGTTERRSLLGLIAIAVRDEGPRHLGLVLASLFLSIFVGVPLGVAATRTRAAGAIVTSVASLVQTIPSLALLCFLIPLLGTGTLPALVALFLYGLLPIVRNTKTGIEGIPVALIESSKALGLPASTRLFRVELPLASPTILAGIRTSAVISVGTATLAAFIGAGGFGAPISVGLNLNDTTMILAGAIPAALLALSAEGVFALLGRVLIPKGLRLSTATDSSR